MDLISLNESLLYVRSVLKLIRQLNEMKYKLNLVQVGASGCNN